MVLGDRREVSGLEKTLHFLLDKWRIEHSLKVEGHSEWFAMECFDKAIEIIRSAATLRDFTLDNKFILGIPVTDYKKSSKVVIRAEPIRKVVANFESITSQWPYYKKGTLDFRDHPDLDDTWLWTVDIGESSINPVDVMCFQYGNVVINVITEVFYYTNQPSIIQAN